ncbi:MAG: hypothetical protein FWG98_04060 [Candidatus Cloacimonetes bacterium]|nr:hypothetical protein [Candidatus Cloacimonadota bacterium]
MGTQQVIMIVLTVVLVGAAVAMAINMFDTQSRNQARNAVASDIIQFGTQAQAWFRTPVMMGGGGGSFESTDMLSLLGFLNSGWGTSSITDYLTPNGSYTFAHRGGNIMLIIGTSAHNPNLILNGLIFLPGGNEEDNYGITISSGAQP